VPPGCRKRGSTGRRQLSSIVTKTFFLLELLHAFYDNVPMFSYYTGEGYGQGSKQSQQMAEQDCTLFIYMGY